MQTVFEEPKITIGGVPIIQQGFSWSLTAGVHPFVRSFIVPKGALNDALQALANPTFLSVDVFGGVGTYSLKSIQFNNVYLLEGKALDDFNMSWQIADSRFAWRGKKIYCSYNKTRPANLVGNFSVSGELNPAILRRPFDTFGVGRYVPWSVKDGKPLNMRQIILDILDSLGIPTDQTIGDDEGSYMIENVEYSGIDIYSCLADLLAKSRLQLGILPSGSVYVYSIDFFDESQVNLLLQQQSFQKTGPGTLYKQELSRIRPKKVKVKFEKKIETWVMTASSEGADTDSPLLVYTSNSTVTADDAINRKVIGCENVIRVPVPLASWKVGEYVPMWKFLQAVGLTETEVRTLWFGSRLEFRLAQILTGGGAFLESNYNIANIIVSAIRQSYRQVYMLDPYYINQIATWETKRVSVIDNYSRYSPPVPLYADCCIIPGARTPSVAKKDATWQNISYNWIVDTEDPYRARPTVGTISTVAVSLGIFQISYPGDLSQVVESIIPSAVDDLPLISPTTPGRILWTQASLKESHTMETIISVVWNAKQESALTPLFAFDFPNKYWEENFDYTREGGKGPDIEYLSKLEYARMPLRIYDQNGEILPEFDVNRPMNSQLLNALAASEAAKLMNQFKNRIVGIVKMAGILDIKLNGNIESITFSFGNAGLETILDMRQIPADPSYEQTLPQSAIDFLRRHVSRGDSASEMSAGAK